LLILDSLVLKKLRLKIGLCVLNFLQKQEKRNQLTFCMQSIV